MAGVAGKSGGRRRGAGRKPRDREQELDKLFAEHLTPDMRVQVMLNLASRARNETAACSLLFSYLYGKPKTLDEAEIEARVEAELNGFFDKITTRLGEGVTAQVLAAVFGDAAPEHDGTAGGAEDGAQVEASST